MLTRFAGKNLMSSQTTVFVRAIIQAVKTGIKMYDTLRAVVSLFLSGPLHFRREKLEKIVILSVFGSLSDFRRI